MQQENKSEVARLMQQIALEHEAAERAMSGMAYGVARHAFMTARTENIGRCHQQLRQLVGPQEAMRLLLTAEEQKA